MTRDKPTIQINVTLSANPGKPSGYQFNYESDSGLVDADGTVDLSGYDHDDVVMLYALLAMGGVQPTFAVDTAHPNQIDQAVWFADWPKDQPLPAPCPTGPGQANSSFRSFSLPSASQLQFTNKNKDNRRYAYALRVVIPPGTTPVADDPIIINKIAAR